MFSWFKKKMKPSIEMSCDYFFELLSRNVEPYNIQVYAFSTTDGITTGVSYFIHNLIIFTFFKNGAVYEYNFGIKSPNVRIINFNQSMLDEYTQLLINKMEEYKKYQITIKLEEIKKDFE